MTYMTFIVSIMASKGSQKVDTKLAVTDLECLKEAFALFDQDRDGEINTEQLHLINIFGNL
jgi:Ca2+-binding EF-hand superfamily protein